MASNTETVTRPRRSFITLGLFIIDEFSFADAAGNPTGERRSPEIGGGGTYASIGARIWLPPHELGMIVDTGADFPPDIRSMLEVFGEDMWYFRTQAGHETTRAINNFEYLTPRIRLTPRDLVDTPLANPRLLHFICSPQRARVIISELRELNWTPITVYEPIPFRCVPEELSPLLDILPSIDILSPNAEEAMSLLSIPGAVTREGVEEAAKRFVDAGVGREGKGVVVIRSAEMGSFVLSRQREGEWVNAYWQDQAKVVDVTGAGNAFLGGLAAGIALADGDVHQAVRYASVSASFVIEQGDLPRLTRSSPEEYVSEKWNGESPRVRLEKL